MSGIYRRVNAEDVVVTKRWMLLATASAAWALVVVGGLVAELSTDKKLNQCLQKNDENLSGVIIPLAITSALQLVVIGKYAYDWYQKRRMGAARTGDVAVPFLAINNGAGAPSVVLESNVAPAA